MLESLFNKVAGFAGSATLLKKKSPTQVFSCGVCETFKNIYFVEHLQTAASGSCKHSTWTCFVIKNVDSTEFFREMKLPSPHPEAVVWRCSVEKLFFDISQNSQENTCARVSFLVKFNNIF